MATATYDVEQILDHRGPRSRRRYLAKWKGHGEEENSWVSRSDFVDKAFLADYDQSAEARAKELWTSSAEGEQPVTRIGLWHTSETLRRKLVYLETASPSPLVGEEGQGSTIASIAPVLHSLFHCARAPYTRFVLT